MKIMLQCTWHYELIFLLKYHCGIWYLQFVWDISFLQESEINCKNEHFLNWIISVDHWYSWVQETQEDGYHRILRSLCQDQTTGLKGKILQVPQILMSRSNSLENKGTGKRVIRLLFQFHTPGFHITGSLDLQR